MIIPLAFALTSAATADIRQSPTTKRPELVQFAVGITVFEVEGAKSHPFMQGDRVCADISDFLKVLDRGASLMVINDPVIRTTSGFQSRVEFQSTSGPTKDREQTETSLEFTPTALTDGTISMEIQSTFTHQFVKASPGQARQSTNSNSVARLRPGNVVVIKDSHVIIVLSPAIVQE